MKAPLPSIALTIMFALLANALLLSGLIRYGNDTAHWDIPYRGLASALTSQGDLPCGIPASATGFHISTSSGSRGLPIPWASSFP